MNELSKEKLEQLKQLCSDLKSEINDAFNEDPHNQKMKDYEELFGRLGQIEEIIEKIK